MPAALVSCNCPLRPFTHQISKAEKREHDRKANGRESLATEKVADEAFTAAMAQNTPTPSRFCHSLPRAAPANDNASGVPPVSAPAILTDLQKLYIASNVEHRSASNTQRKGVLQMVLKRVDDAITLLESARSEGPMAEPVESLRKKVTAARDAAVVASNTLKPLKETPEKLDVVSRFKVLESLVEKMDAMIPPETAPFYYDSGYAMQNPIGSLSVTAQIMFYLAAACHLLLGLAIGPTNFILGSVTFLLQTAMLHTHPNPDGTALYDAVQQDLLDQLPPSLYVAMDRLKLDGKTVIYATCPSCHHIHAPRLPTSGVPTWPATCENEIVGKIGRSICSTPLLAPRKDGLHPIKPYVSSCFLDYIARLLSNPDTEQVLDQTCDAAFAAHKNSASKKPLQPIDPAETAFRRTPAESIDETPPTFVEDAFQGAFFTTFEGPVDGKLFIDRGSRMRLAFSVSLDFFPPRGSRKRSNHDSLGVLTVACLNLPVDIRYRPENLHVGIITGRVEPKLEQINPYLKPIIDKAILAWERGIHISKTGNSPELGRIVDIAIVLSINDLPAARKLAGMAAHNSHHFCSCCTCFGRRDLYRTDFANWKKRDAAELRRYAEAWRDANTLAEREAIFEQYGVRWSEMWRLPYWDPCRMLAPDTMHCVLEGLVHYHCREVLQLNLDDAKKVEQDAPAFDQNFAPYEDRGTPEKLRIRDQKTLDQVATIHGLLVKPLRSNEEAHDVAASIDIAAALSGLELTEDALHVRLCRNNKPALIFVCWTLHLPRLEISNPLTREDFLTRQTKKQLSQLLLDWRKTKPLADPAGGRPKSITTEDLRFIQKVIASTTTPAWVNHVPKNYGEKNAGSLKADEWRLLATIYVPIALVILWGEQVGPNANHFRSLLAHSMALFQAVTIVCRYTMTETRANAYREFLKVWLDGLHSTHPHTRHHRPKTNPHVAFHIFDFLLLFGPVLSWWCFPFERLIGILQKINSNDRVGGEHEATILKSWMRAANLRRWLNRTDCPESLLPFKNLFDRHLGMNLGEKKAEASTGGTEERAHFSHKGVHYSRASTHLGNSLVMFYPESDGVVQTNKRKAPVPGSIERIAGHGDNIRLTIRRQAPLLNSRMDPFQPFRPYFPAETYSSRMATVTEVINPSCVIGHYARFCFSNDRAVILDLSRV